MFASSSDDDDHHGGDRSAAGGGRQAAASSTMKSIFASETRSAATGNQSLKYEPKKKDTIVAAATAAAASPAPIERGSAPAPGQTNTAAAATASVMAYRGDSYMGPAAFVVAVAPAQASIMLVDRERRTLVKVRVDDSLQLLPSSEDHQYATLYDPMTQVHWSLLFKSANECHTFVASALSVQHFLLLTEGPRSPVLDLVDVLEGPPAHNGDTVVVSLLVFMLQRVGTTYTCGKLIDEIVADAPRRIILGQNDLMLGVEEALIGARAGGWKLVFVPPRKSKTSGLGNPEIGPKDTVVALVRLHSVDSVVPEHAADKIVAIEDRRPPSSKVAAVDQQSAAPAAASPAGGGDDLFKMLLLQTLQMQQQQAAQFQAIAQAQTHPPPPPPPAPAPVPSEAPIPAHVERSLDRINQQLSALYEKIDRLDFEKKLDTNNEKLERIVKKAVGKMPVNDVDIEDAAKDRDQLLAKLEALKARVDEMTDNYHEALQQLGKSREVLDAAKNDLAIERSTSETALIDLKERHRLQIVEAEVRMRRAVDDARELALKDGHEAGYQEGYNAGKIDAMTTDGGNESVVRLRELVTAREQEIVAQKSRNAELEHRMYEDRKLASDEKKALRGLIDKLEAKEKHRQSVIYDHATAVAKTIRRVMNATYTNFESQVYATEKITVDVQDVLNMAMVAVRAEARQATDELKREALIRSSEPAHHADETAAEDESDFNEHRMDQPDAPADVASAAALPASKESDAIAAATASHIYGSLPDGANEILREIAATRGAWTEHSSVETAGPLSEAYAMPTSNIAPGEIADEDEIMAYLSDRKDVAE